METEGSEDSCPSHWLNWINLPLAGQGQTCHGEVSDVSGSLSSLTVPILT